MGLLGIRLFMCLKILMILESIRNFEEKKALGVYFLIFILLENGLKNYAELLLNKKVMMKIIM